MIFISKNFARNILDMLCKLVAQQIPAKIKKTKSPKFCPRKCSDSTYSRSDKKMYKNGKYDQEITPLKIKLQIFINIKTLKVGQHHTFTP